MNNDENRNLIKDNSEKDNFQIWKHNFHSKRIDLVKLCIQNEEKTNRIYDFINDEEKNHKLNSQRKIDKIEKKIKNKMQRTIIPEKVQNNINETRRLNEDLRQKVNDISKMNSLSVLKNCEKYLNNNESELLLPKLDSKIKKEPNFRYVNDNYRQQLMNSFLNFNPKIHLYNLRNLLEKADPAIHNDLNNLWQTIETDLKEVSDPHYYAKKYNILKQKNLEFKKRPNSREKFLKINSGILTRKETYKTDIAETVPKSVTKTNHSYEKMRTNKGSRFEGEMKKETIDDLMDSLRQDKIANYIENQHGFDPNINYEEQIIKYFAGIKKVEDVLHKIHLNKLNKVFIAEEAKDTISIQNDNLIKYIKEASKDIMKSFIKEEVKI